MSGAGCINSVEAGDCREFLARLPAGSVDSCVTDPPYELGFMGRKWDATGIAYSVDVWREVLRVLKPGAHLLAFGGTRTHHRMVCAIEDAGFEIRDEIQWLYGSGFPKSLDVSKSIDKAAGVERAVVGESNTINQKHSVSLKASKANPEYGDRVPITAPATAEAKQWTGWGTALKPACEPICVARKPLEGTVAANVLKHGTGGVNVDGCRVGTEAGGRGGGGSKLYAGGLSREGGDARPTQGRWPANVILSHSPECVCTGTKRVRGNDSPNSYRQTGSGRSIFGIAPIKKGGSNNADADGLETVEAWHCVEGCPVKVLDGQSGVLKSGYMAAGEKFSKGSGMFGGGKSNADTYGDTGGASRFFYTAKASKSDRGEGNNHPTVKPTALMRYLVRLVTPPGGLVLDPFAGSGTTLLAAKLEGFNFTGCDLDPAHVEIINRRLENAGFHFAHNLVDTPPPL